MKDRPREVHETKLINVIREEAIPTETLVQIPVENFVHEERAINVQVATIVNKEREKRVDVAQKVETTVYVPKLKYETVDVPVVSKIVFDESFVQEVPINKIVYKDRVLDVPVETRTEVLVPETNKKEVPVEFIVYNEQEVQVPVETIAYEDKVVPVDVDKIVYKDKEVEVTLEKTMDKPVYEDRIIKVELPKLVIKSKDVEVFVEKGKIDNSSVVKVPVQKLKYEDRKVEFQTVRVKHQETEVKANHEKIKEKVVEKVKEVPRDIVKYEDRMVLIPRLNIVDSVKEVIKTVEIRVPDVTIQDKIKEVPGKERIVAKPQEKIVNVDVEVFEASVKRVPKVGKVTAEILHENVVVDKRKVEYKVPVETFKYNDSKVDRKIEKLKVEKKVVDKKLTSQVVDVRKEKVVETFGTKHQPLNNIPEYRDNVVEIYEETEERRTEEVPKAVFLRETVITDRLLPIEAVEIREKVVELVREVPVERLEEVEVPVHVEGADGHGALAVMMSLEASINAQALAKSVSERRFAQEERALRTRLEAERSRRKALQEALAKRENPASIVREEIKEVEVKREEADFQKAATAAEDKTLQSTMDASLRQAKDSAAKAAAAAAKADEERGAAVAKQLQLKRKLEQTLARMQRLEGELRDPAARERLVDFVRVPVISKETAQNLKPVWYPGESELPQARIAKRIEFASSASTSQVSATIIATVEKGGVSGASAAGAAIFTSSAAAAGAVAATAVKPSNAGGPPSALGPQSTSGGASQPPSAGSARPQGPGSSGGSTAGLPSGPPSTSSGPPSAPSSGLPSAPPSAPPSSGSNAPAKPGGPASK